MLPSGRRRSLHEQGHNTEDLRVVARSFKQMVAFNACGIPLSLCNTFGSTSFSCQAPAPSTTMTSAYGLGAGTVGLLLFGQCLGFTNTPNDLLLKPMSHCVYVSVDGVLAESSDVHGLVSTSTDHVQLRLIPSVDQAGTLPNGRLFFAF